MKARAIARHADRVEAAITAGHAARSALVASWQRSSRLHQLDPAVGDPPLRLTDAELQHARERAGTLVAAAQSPMNHLLQGVGAVGCCVLLADSDGVPIERRGAAADDATFKSWGLWTGSVWSEEREGTNGIGTCLVEQRALTIDRGQHFLTRNTLLSCTAAPIYDHDAKLVGVLDVSSCRADRTDALGNLISLAISETVRRIEAAIFQAAFPKERILLTPPDERGLGGLMAVDADDLVVAATRSARLALGIAPDGLKSPVPAADLLGGSASTREELGHIERGVLQRALLRSRGNVSAAAHALGVSRATMHRKLKRLELRPH